MNKIANLFKADEGLCLLKRLENGQYMNLTDLDFEDSRNSNNDYYDITAIHSKYVLMADVVPGKIVYAPVSLEQLLAYAPSIKKLKKCSIADVIIAKLMYENKSIRFSLIEDDDETPQIKIWLKVSKDNNTRYEVVAEESFDAIVESF